MTVKADLIAAMKAFAEATNDLDFIEGWGVTGLESGGSTHRTVEIRNETVWTGQVWLNDPNFAEGMFQAVAEVLGDWQGEDFDVTAGTGVTLAKTPLSTGVLFVFHDGVLLRRVTSPNLATEYGWTAGSKIITFGTYLTGWIHARYLASS